MSIELTAMVGTTLVDFRDFIDTLACESGPYYLVCARTGERPVPVATARFPDRKTAESAARAAEHYREALRRYDHRLPYLDVIVCEETCRPSQRAVREPITRRG